MKYLYLMQKQIDFISLIDAATATKKPGRKASARSKIICNGNPGSRKKVRPFNRKQALHVTMQSSQAKGAWGFLRHDNYFTILDLIERLRIRFQITVEKQSINSNHLHLLLRAKDKKALSGFLRALSGLIVRQITKTERGQKLSQKFWNQRPFSRIVTFGRDFAGVVKYIVMNVNESIGDRSLGRYFGARKILQV